MRDNINIGFIGAGRVGTSLGKYLSINGFNVTEYFSRSLDSAEDSAAFIGGGCKAVHNLCDLSADIIFITVNDNSIGTVAAELAALPKDKLNDRLFCHTSGSMSAEILNPISDKSDTARTASLHMLLSVNDKFESCKDFGKAFFTLDGCGAEELRAIIDLCGNGSRIIDSACKAKYHAAAVFASNFAVALSHIGCSLLEECGFEYNEALNALAPLIRLNAENIAKYGPKKALTGPAQRGDTVTLKHHRSVLDGKYLEIYNALTDIIITEIK